MTNKKRTSLDALGLSSASLSVESGKSDSAVVQSLPKHTGDEELANIAKKTSKKTEIAKTTVYVPRSVFDQWRELAFIERKKMHDYLLEGLDRVFADRGLKSIDDLTGKE